jgi:hypothetical protein
MSKISFVLGVCVTLGLCVHQAAAARKHASAHQLTTTAGLSEKQKQLRKASETAEANMVCRKPEVKDTINADTSVDGVTDINWDTVTKTAADGMKSIEGSIESLTLDIKELEERIKELEEAGRWGELGAPAMNEMLHAACTSFQQEGNPTDDCSWAVEGNCGWEDPALMDAFIEPPFDEPIAKFKEVATSKITGYARLPVAAFRKHCASVLSADMCGDLCLEFTEVVRELSTKEAAEVLGNTDTLDGLRAQHKTKTQELANAEAEKETCAEAQKQLEAFRAQLSKLSGNYKSSKSAVGRYKRTLRMQQMRLRRQIQILEQKRQLLERAKAVFAAASQQVIERQKDVDHMQAIVDDLIVQLKKQMELIAEIEQKIAEIDAATDTARKIKSELVVILQNAHDTQVQTIHKPFEGLKITPGTNLAQIFDTADEDAAPAMKSTVRVVADYCTTEDVTNALTSPLIKLEGQSKELNFICVGQDWNNMISEAQATVKGAAKQVVDILVEEQNGLKSDINVPVSASMAVMEANGEPKGTRHAIATFGGSGSFFDSYVNPGWTVAVNDGAVGAIGKMLQLYQKLGEAAEEMDAQWEAATAHARVLEQKKKEALAELARLQELLEQAIKAKQIAKEKMDEAQKVFDENKELKDKMQADVDKSTETLAEGEKAVAEVKDELLKEHRERAAALLQILQELKK